MSADEWHGPDGAEVGERERRIPAARNRGRRQLRSSEAAPDGMPMSWCNALLWAREDCAQSVIIVRVEREDHFQRAAVARPREDVLLGDPQQLEQPRTVSHPEGVNDSALQHILGPPDHSVRRGIFCRSLAPRDYLRVHFRGVLLTPPDLAAWPGSQQLTGGPFTGSGLGSTSGP